ncbi:MAG TPA: hypothetical protein VHD90_27640 [Phototrophicaceae bacterium]|nr:hypothetical protein [Phototrophicaceae bacterium]
MNFLKRIFGASGGVGGDVGIYYYVKPKGCDEIVRVRINRNNDLSLADDGKTLWVHKVVMGQKCFQRVELDLYFNQSRQLTNSEISGGELVKEADYQAWLDAQEHHDSGDTG